MLRLFFSFADVLEIDLLTTSLLATVDQDWQNMIQRTINSNRSIGAIHWTLRELKKTDEDLLKKLEKRIGAAHWSRLIRANGDMAVLQRLMHHMTFEFRKEMAAYATTFSPNA